MLALEPRLVVADEPTSGLDPDRRASVLEALIGNLPKTAACILVTHDMSSAHDWCQRTLVMLSGRVIEELDLRQHQPQHPYARLLFDPWSAPVPKGPLAQSGCPFQPDCALSVGALVARCRSTVPTLLPSESPSHRVACHAVDAVPPPETP